MTARPALLGGPPAFPEGLPLARPQVGDVPAIVRRLAGVIDSGVLTNGPWVRTLEETVAVHLGVGHVVAVSSCTSGLMLVLVAAGATGRVVMPSFTFAATAHAAHWAGGRPAWVDVDPASLTVDPAGVAAAVDGSSAVVAVHLYGTPCDVGALEDVATAAGVPLVFDAAHALGAHRRGRPVGGSGTAEVFSLSPTKVVTGGEGGLIATNDSALAEACRLGRDYGNPGDYDCLFPGLNARMSELHATVALASFDGLDRRVARRNVLARCFREGLAGRPGVRFPVVADGDVSTVKDMTLLVDADVCGLTAAQLQAALRAEGVDSRRYYHPPVHRQKAYAYLGPPPDLPVTDRVAEQVLTVPLWTDLPFDAVERLADTVATLFDHADALAGALP